MKPEEAPGVVMETERVVLREMTLGDVDDLMLLFSDPLAMRYYPSTKTRPGSRALGGMGHR